MKGDVATFRTPDPCWTASSHALGRGRFQPRNVRFGPRGLTIALAAGELDGGELQSQLCLARGSGDFRARLRAADSPGSLSAFFFYRYDSSTKTQDELDFEIPGGEPPRALVTVWRMGVAKPVAHREIRLPFDPAASLHDYELRRDGAEVSFLIDGCEVFRDAKAPTVELRPMFNAWYPTWLEPATPPQAGEMTVDGYSFHPPA